MAVNSTLPPLPPYRLAASPALERLNRQLTACRRCPRLVAHREHVARAKTARYRDWTYWGKPVPGFGDPHARLLLVGLAPGAHGSNRTGRMFTGDASGDFLYEALHHFGFSSSPVARSADDGLTLTDCYITAAARCAPPGNKPTRQEFDTCRSYLERELLFLPNVRVVLGLGHVGHEAWLRASGWWARLPASKRPRFAHGSVARLPDGVVLVGAYHPSRQNTNTGKLTRRMWYAAFRTVRDLLDGMAGRRDAGRAGRTAGRRQVPEGASVSARRGN
jgi:uracil-DNA glycosylase family 4